MNRNPFVLFVAPLFAGALLACSSSSGTTGGTESTSSTSKPASGGSAHAAGSSSSSGAAAPAAPAAAIDPKMLELSKDVMSCKYDHQSFVDCKALDAFRSSKDPYFDTEAADKTLAEMLAGSDEKLAVIAAARYAHDASKAVKDKALVERLFAAVERPKNPYGVQSALVRWLAQADFEKLGLADRLKGLAKNSDVAVRKSIGFGIVSGFGAKNPSQGLAIELVGSMLADADKDVVKSASMGLSNAASDTKACELLAAAIDKADEKSDFVVWSAGSSHRCKGLAAKVVEYVDKKASDPSKVTNMVGIDYAQGVEFSCRDEADGSDVKKKGYAVALHLVDPKVPDSNTRYAAMSTLLACDEKGGAKAKSEIEKMSKDKQKFVADMAKKKLDELAKKK